MGIYIAGHAVGHSRPQLFRREKDKAYIVVHGGSLVSEKAASAVCRGQFQVPLN
jgi:hypothetical protein